MTAPRYYDYEDRSVKEDKRPRANWMPLLFLPLFFVFGWLSRDVLFNRTQNTVGTPEYGIGGGPEIPTTTPGVNVTSTPIPTITIVPTDMQPSSTTSGNTGM